mgnify:CR=1 FL=1|jgi:hypothetical protein
MPQINEKFVEQLIEARQPLGQSACVYGTRDWPSGAAGMGLVR